MAREKVVPGSDTRFEEAFDFAFLMDEVTVNFLSKHGRIMFIIRGLPGTGKSTLSSLIISKYPSSTKCSADDYFSEPFVSKTRDSQSIKKSHVFCLNKASDACKKNQHPIILQNSHVRKWEMQSYIDLAEEYCYTVIMAITTQKIAITPKVLAETNTQGLNQNYFLNRIKQWEDVVPQYTGWFLNPSDTAFISRQTEISLSSLQEEQFNSIFCASGDPVEYFEWENRLFCIARYCNEKCGFRSGNPGKAYYLSNEVQLCYGKHYKLTVLGFIFSESLALALVQLSDGMLELRGKNNEVPFSAEYLSDTFAELNITERKNASKLLCKDLVSFSEETYVLSDWKDNETICINSCSVIVLASSKKNPPYFPFVKNVQSFCKSLFVDVSDSKGNINIDNFVKLESGTSFCRLPHNSWFILSYKKITVDAIFTGYYI